MKSKKFQLPPMDFSSFEIQTVDTNKMDSKTSTRLPNEAQIIDIKIKDKISFENASLIKAKLLENEHAKLELIDINEMDLSGIQLILSAQKSNRTVNLNIDEIISDLLINTGFRKLSNKNNNNEENINCR